MVASKSKRVAPYHAGFAISGITKNVVRKHFPRQRIKLSIYIALKPQAGTMIIWMPNQPLQNGRFLIQKVLGSGGFGITYSILEQPTGKLFVLKTLNHIQQIRKDFSERQVKFVQEMTRLARCTQKNIVKF